MKNREKLAQMSNQEIAEYICRTFSDCCVCCPGDYYCKRNSKPANGNGLVKWLEHEAEEDDV